MKTNHLVTFAFGLLSAGFLLSPNCVMAQAPPGPIAPPPPGATSEIPPDRPAAKPAPPKPKEPPRTTIAGFWKFNVNDSDDAKEKARMGSSGGTNAGSPPPSTYPGGYPGGGYPGGGYPGQYPGRYPGGGYPGGGYPGGGRRPTGDGGQDLANNPKIQPYLHASDTLEVALKNPEVDMTDDHFNKLILYTDDRQVPKKNDDESRVEVDAHWNGTQLVSDEKSPLSGKMSRTFELSPDGRQLYEILSIDNGRHSPLVIRYVYDAAHSDIQTGAAPAASQPASQEDPNRPTLKRNSDDSSNPPQ